jgi:hypothetical protein
MGQRLALVTSMLLVLMAAGWLAVAGMPSTSGERLPAFARQRWPIALLLLAWLATMRSYAMFIAPHTTQHELLFLGAITLALLAALVLDFQQWQSLSIALVAGIGIRLFSFAHMPIEPARGDMLPLVQGALANLLTGQSPYAIYSMPWQLPLTYLPVTWLAYLPPYLAGLDIRLTNLLADISIGLLLLWLASSRGTERWTVPLLWAWFFLQPSAVNWSLSTTAPVFWALLCLLLVLVLAERPHLAAVALGLCGAASSLAAVALPFVLLHWLRWYGWRRMLVLAGIAGVVAAVCILPFLLRAPQQFVYGAFQWFNDNDLYPRLRWEMDHTWARQTGFSGVFWRRGLEDMLKPIQAVLLVVLAVLNWRRGATVRQLAPFIAAAFLLFVVFNPVLWPYLYNPALVAALVALVGMFNGSHREERYL